MEGKTADVVPVPDKAMRLTHDTTRTKEVHMDRAHSLTRQCIRGLAVECYVRCMSILVKRSGEVKNNVQANGTSTSADEDGVSFLCLGKFLVRETCSTSVVQAYPPRQRRPAKGARTVEETNQKKIALRKNGRTHHASNMVTDFDVRDFRAQDPRNPVIV